jgi:hypothetical protein
LARVEYFIQDVGKLAAFGPRVLETLCHDAGALGEDHVQDVLKLSAYNL